MKNDSNFDKFINAPTPFIPGVLAELTPKPMPPQRSVRNQKRMPS